jgi:hypothetical protein
MCGGMRWFLCFTETGLGPLLLENTKMLNDLYALFPCIPISIDLQIERCRFFRSYLT